MSIAWMVSAGLLLVAPLPPVSTPPVPASPPAAQYTESVPQLVSQAKDQLRAYDFEGARQTLDRALALDPFDLEANLLARTVYASLGSEALLEQRYRQLVAANPDSAAAYYLLASAASSADDRQTYLRLALQKDPGYAPAKMSLAMSSYDADIERALAAAYDWVTAAPGDYRAAMTYFAMLERLGRRPEAIGFLRQMTASYPSEVRFWTRLWHAEMRAMGRDRDLSRLLPQINAQRFRFMDSLEHMEMLADVLLMGGGETRDLAVELWQTIAERYPEHPRAELALLRALMMTGDVDAKIRALESLAERYPASAARYPACYRIIIQLLHDERYDEATAFAKSLLELPDPPSDPKGLARDPEIAGMSQFGSSFECIGHAGWFAAAQAPIADASGAPLDWRGMLAMIHELELQTVVAPQSAAAAQSLLNSQCMSANVFVAVGSYLARSGSYRRLGIEILERAVEIHRSPERAVEIHRSPAADAPSSSDFSHLSLLIDLYRELLPWLYLQEGRLDDALQAVARLTAEDGRRSVRFWRIAGEVYEAAGDLEAAKRAYVRGLSSGLDAEFVRAALDRLYGRSDQHPIVIYAAEEAPTLPVERTRVRRVHLGVDAPLTRFLGEDLTVVLLWSRALPASRDLAAALAKLSDPLAESGIATLPIAVARSSRSTASRIARDPFAGTAHLGVVVADEDFATWNMAELPATLLVDRSGRVWASQLAFGLDPAEWANGLTAMLERLAGRARQ